MAYANNRVAFILSGSGHLDGTEITEAVSLMVLLTQVGFELDFFAPDRAQMHVVDHLTKSEQAESRNILVEAARIARGNISGLDSLDSENYIGAALPGGFGAVKNFTTFLQDGVKAKLYPDVRSVLVNFLNFNKALLAVCASPLVLALAARDANRSDVKVTLGLRCDGEDLVNAVEAWGGVHEECKIDSCCIDYRNRLVTAAAYMYSEATPAQVFASCAAAVNGFKELVAI